MSIVLCDGGLFKVTSNDVGYGQKTNECTRDTIDKAVKSGSETPPATNCASESHSEGETTSDLGTADSPATPVSSIWPTNVFLSQYSMLGTNGLAGLQKVLEVCSICWGQQLYFFFVKSSH